MQSPLTRKLSSFADLSAEDQQALEALGSNARSYPAGHILIREGDRPEEVFLLMSGWAYRYKLLRDGSRQIMAYLIPGDLCDIHIFILKEMDHGIGLLSNAKVAAISRQEMASLLDKRPMIARSLFWATLVDEAVLREWLVNMGQRDAYERIAHLFCEMWTRMHKVGLVLRQEFSLPLTQEELGDTLGLTSVHINRMLQRMRAEGLISLSKGQLTIHNIDRMREVAGFNPNYLHLDRRA
jgi:CRP-like cAMP-binding protein